MKAESPQGCGLPRRAPCGYPPPTAKTWFAAGKRSIRIACVLELDSLRAALRCLAEGLRAYLAAHPDQGVGTPPRAT